MASAPPPAQEPPASDKRRDTDVMGSLIARFLDHLTLSAGRSANTLMGYRRDLERYRQYCEANGVSHPREIEAQTVGSFVAALAGEMLAPASIARALSAVKSLHRYLLQSDIVATNPARSIKTPRLPRKLPGV